ncbi:MAG TPA: hypothetical protein VFU29_22270 [Chitinophagaceae bacterium]|nr:hypothetical protein [Chitinophagaceae bacterium]
MASKRKKKYYKLPQYGAKRQAEETEQDEAEEMETPSTPAVHFNLSAPVPFSMMVTAGFFVIALIGVLSHEMWRDEHQAWLVARDATSLSGLLENMKYEGNPALWQFCLFLITRVTHDPVFMQAFHLLIATSFIFIFNRYAPLRNFHKILFSFGYFALYEYAVISRSYALGILLVFIVCALYKNRTTRYILIGVILALLSNVTIYALVFSAALAAILLLDYFVYQQKTSKVSFQLAAGMVIFIIGFAFSVYQIWPEKDNSFPVFYPANLFDAARWWQVSAKLFVTHAYIPRIEEHFWNTNIFYNDSGIILAGSFSEWLRQNPSYWFSWVLMPIVIFASAVIIFLRRPLILLLYIGITICLLSIYYYTALFYSRYCGYLLIALIFCWWLAEYYPERKYGSRLAAYLSQLGKKISSPFLTTVLTLSVIGSLIAYGMDIKYKFSPSKDVANYIKQSKIDTLPIVGMVDFAVSPLSTYLDKKIYYLQMADSGSFIIWNKKRKDQMSFEEILTSIGSYIDNGHPQVVWVANVPLEVEASDDRGVQNMTKAILRNDLQLDLLSQFSPGIVKDEQYYVYLLKKVDPATIDRNKYIKIN